jgi:plasmid replication initiation protein
MRRIYSVFFCIIALKSDFVYNVVLSLIYIIIMHYNTAPKVLISKTPKAYKDKKLNNANFGNFSHNDYQVFLHLVSKIGGVDKEGKYLQPEQLQREYILTAKEFSEVFYTDIDNSYRYLKKAIDKLMKTDIKVERPDNQSIVRINVCSKAEYKKKEGLITLKFTDDIMPYLSQVRKKFVLYNLKEIANFNSLFTTRLYELIQEFKDTGYIVRSVEQLRTIFAVGNNFQRYNDFKKRTFDHACKEINLNHAMNLGYEEIKKGRKVVAIKFIFNKTKIYKVTNQKTGVEKNFYAKPESKPKKQKNKTKIINSDILEGQLAFSYIKKEPKPIQSILAKVLNKFKY